MDRLVAFTKPVFVYIPPLAELRGGAWVVVDPTINQDCMEMYAASDARGGVLEPEALVQIKYRTADLLETMHRLDAQLAKLDAEVCEARLDQDLARETRARSDVSIREKLLLPVYTQVAVHFADLHDTPFRMAATGVIRRVVPWPQARSFFYWRLARRLAEFAKRDQILAKRKVATACGLYEVMDTQRASKLLEQCFVDERLGAPWDDDKAALAWLADPKRSWAKLLATTEAEAVRDVVKTLVAKNPAAALEGLADAAKSLTTRQKRALKDALLASLS